MGIMVLSLIWVMQELYHQPYLVMSIHLFVFCSLARRDPKMNGASQMSEATVDDINAALTHKKEYTHNSHSVRALKVLRESSQQQ